MSVDFARVIKRQLKTRPWEQLIRKCSIKIDASVISFRYRLSPMASANSARASTMTMLLLILTVSMFEVKVVSSRVVYITEDSGAVEAYQLIHLDADLGDYGTNCLDIS